MSFIPGGFEDDESDDDEFGGLVYGHDPSPATVRSVSQEPAGSMVREQQQNNGSTAASSQQPHWIASSQTDRDNFNWDFTPPPIQTRAFVSIPPSPNPSLSGRRSVHSPSPGGLFLDDVRTAIINGNVDFVTSNMSPDKGMCMDTILKNGWTGLMYASSCANPDLVQFFLEKGADPNFHRDMFTSLMATCASANPSEDKIIECVRLLLKYNANVKSTDRFLNNALMHAIKKGRKRLVQFLLENGSEINKPDGRGFTPIHLAAQAGKGEIVRVLLDGGANPEALTNDGLTPADVAYEAGHEKIADIIERIRKEKESRQLTEIEIATLQEEKNTRPPSAIYNYTTTCRATSRDSRRGILSDLEVFLNGLGLSYYMPTLENNHVSLRDLMLYEEDDLVKIGIDKLGDRKKIIEAVRGVTKSEWRATSLPNLRSLPKLSCPDAVVVVENIAKQLHYIESSVAYLRNQIKKQPLMLEHGQDVANVSRLMGDVDECLNNTHLVFEEIRFLKKDIAPLQDSAEHYPPNEIGPTKLILSDEDESANGTSRTFTAVGAFIMVTLGAVAIFKFHRVALVRLV